jgi:hypothetical protein
MIRAISALVFPCAEMFAGAMASAAGPEVDRAIAVVRRASGEVRMLPPDSYGTATDVGTGDLQEINRNFVTGKVGQLSLRFHPDLMLLDVLPGTRIEVDVTEYKESLDPHPRKTSLDMHPRRVALAGGRLRASLSRQGPGISVEDSHSRVRSSSGRLSLVSDSRGTVVYVLEGEAEVRHRATGEVVIIGRGEKAVSGGGGVLVSRSTASELAAAGLGRNVLEVDFWNPVTGEFRTLEVEHEESP